MVSEMWVCGVFDAWRKCNVSKTVVCRSGNETVENDAHLVLKCSSKTALIHVNMPVLTTPKRIVALHCFRGGVTPRADPSSKTV